MSRSSCSTRCSSCCNSSTAAWNSCSSSGCRCRSRPSRSVSAETRTLHRRAAGVQVAAGRPLRCAVRRSRAPSSASVGSTCGATAGPSTIGAGSRAMARVWRPHRAGHRGSPPGGGRVSPHRVRQAASRRRRTSIRCRSNCGIRSAPRSSLVSGGFSKGATTVSDGVGAYSLGVDLGTTFVAAAVARGHGGDDPRRPDGGHAGRGLRPRRRLAGHRRGREPAGGEQPGAGRPGVQAPPRRPDAGDARRARTRSPRCSPRCSRTPSRRSPRPRAARRTNVVLTHPANWGPTGANCSRRSRSSRASRRRG